MITFLAVITVEVAMVAIMEEVIMTPTMAMELLPAEIAMAGLVARIAECSTQPVPGSANSAVPR